MIKLEKMSVKQPELDLIAEWRNQSMISLRSSDLTAKGESQANWVRSFRPSEKYYFIYDESLTSTSKMWTAHTGLVGYCGLDKIDPVNRTAEIGLLIDPKLHKKGYGKDSVWVLLQIAFNRFNLNCIFAEVLDTTDNIIFWCKQGFEIEGKLKERHFKSGGYYDSKIASITKEEWDKQLLNEVP